MAFLFSQLHFNNVTLDALFHGGHLVMGSKRCAVQNQRITLKVYTKQHGKYNYFHAILISYKMDNKFNCNTSELN